jgi:hypothetical protein
MSYLKSALGISFFDIPTNVALDTTYFLHGIGNDAGYNIYRTTKYIRSQYFGNWYYVTPGGYNLYPLYQTYNGEACFGTAYYLFYDNTYGWVLKDSFLPCYEYWVASESHYFGDDFWSTTSLSTTKLPSEGGGSVEFKAHGYQRGSTKGAYEGTPRYLDFRFIRWESSNLYGEYSPLGGASGTKYVGVPEWNSTYGTNAKYDRSVNVSTSNITPYQSSSGYYTYYMVIAGNATQTRNIYYRTLYSKWLIGVYNSPLGWYEGNEPSKTEDVDFIFTVPEGSEVTGTDITVSFSAYVKGIDTQNIYMCNVGTFLP